MPFKVCVVTSTRADYGLLFWVMKEIDAHPELELRLVATGTHLSPEFGLTYREIERDGFRIDARIEMLMSSDTSVGTCKSLGVGVIGFADAFDRIRPDLLLLLGDRFEILAAAEAALVLRIPVGHIAGGDTTEGAFDESIRHAITKLSHLHFVTNEVAARRVRQMGESPERVHVVGSPGIDYIMRMRFLDRDELAKEIDFEFLERNVLVTFHPATLELVSAEAQMREVLAALVELGENTGILLTMPNADPSGRALASMVDDFVSTHPNSRAYVSLGQVRYLSAMRAVDAVVGNSSSGLYEAPALKKPTVDIGDRQKGRLAATSVIHCEAEARAIRDAIERAYDLDCHDVVNPYGDGSASRRICEVLAARNHGDLLRKSFHFLGETV